MVNQTVGTLTLTDQTVDNATTVTIAGTDGNAFARHNNGIRFESTSATDTIFDGSGATTQDLNISRHKLGSYDITGFSLPTTNQYTDANGDTRQSYGGSWIWEAEYNKVTGETALFNANDLFAPFTASSFASYNQVESTQQEPVKESFFDEVNAVAKWQLTEAGTTVNERQNALITGEVIAGSTLDLSGVDVTLSGTAVQDRRLGTPTGSSGFFSEVESVSDTITIDLGRQMAGTGVESVSQTDVVTVRTRGSDAQSTRLSLGVFDETDAGVSAKLVEWDNISESFVDATSAVQFNSSISTADVEVTGDFTYDAALTGTFTKSVDVGGNIATLENGGAGLVGESVQSSLNIGYRYAVLEENQATASDVTLVAVEGASVTSGRNLTATRVFNASAHTDITVSKLFGLNSAAFASSVADDAIADFNTTVNLSHGNGITGEGLAGELVTAAASYDVYVLKIKGKDITATTEGSKDEGDVVELTNVAYSGAGTPLQAGGQLFVDREGSTRWGFSPDGSNDGIIDAGETQSYVVDFDNTGLAESTLGGEFIATATFIVNDFFDFNTVANGASANGFSRTLFGASGESFTYAFEKIIEATGTSGSATFAAGTDLRGERPWLRFGGSTLTTPTTVQILDSQSLAGETDLNLAFTSLDSAGPVLSAAHRFDRLTSDIVEVTGLDGLLHVIEMSFDESLAVSLNGGSGLFRQAVLWYDEDTNAWVNAILGNSNVDSYTDRTVTIDGVEQTQFEYQQENLFRNTSYEDYLALTGGNLVLGQYGYDLDENVVWAVIDHNSSFGGGINDVPEPSSALLVGLGGLLLLRRRRRGA
ncbi:MAG: PEP-CTERM sorting domain-containing protein [Phycisphaeraceae bacterium]